MTMKEVTGILSAMECGIAEVACDIASGGEVCYPNERILVRICGNPGSDAEIPPGRHWTVCDSVEDFVEGIVYGRGEAMKAYCNYYVHDFTGVKPYNDTEKI